MGFLIIFGLLMTLVAIGVRKQLKWTVDENSCNIKREEKEVRRNKIAYNVMLYGGICLTVIGIIGILI